MNIKKRILPLCLCFLLLLLGCSDTKMTEGTDGTEETKEAEEPQKTQEPQEGSISFFAMDTYITLTAYGQNVEAALALAQDKILALEDLWSVTDENSNVYAINHAGGQAVEVDDETTELLEFALRIADKTNGALDITIYPILSAWGFTTEEYRIPSEAEITGLLSLVDYKNVIQNKNTVQLPADGMIDFGAVAKGYSGDVIADILQENGVTSALLSLGGNIQTIGSKPDGSDWRIGLQEPTGDGIAGILQVSDLAAVTSGAYERYFIGEDGKRYGHIVDPVTGYPIQNDLLSVTVIAKEGRLCDALSTALFVMGAEQATEYWRQNQDFDMILITESDDIYLTAGISENFTVNKSVKGREVHVISE